MDKRTVGLGVLLVATACHAASRQRTQQPSAATTQGDDAHAGDPRWESLERGPISPADKLAPVSGYGSSMGPEPGREQGEPSAGFGGVGASGTGGQGGVGGVSGFGGMGGTGGVREPAGVIASALKVTRPPH